MGTIEDCERNEKCEVKASRRVIMLLMNSNAWLSLGALVLTVPNGWSQTPHSKPPGYLARQSAAGAVSSVIPSVGAVANGASFLNQPVAPGSLITIFGSNLAASQVGASVIPLPTTLSDASVTFNGIPAPLLLVAAQQINAQLPWNVLPDGATSGVVHVVVSRNGSASLPFEFPVGDFGPAIFTLQSGTGQAAAINPDGSVAGVAGSIPGVTLLPASPGDTIVVYATGLGAVTPSIDNAAAPGNILRNTSTMPTVFIGGFEAQVAFAGLSPQFVGVYQINVVVPPFQGILPIQIQFGNVISSDKVTIAVALPY